MSDNTPSLDDLRREIDEIDDAIHDLLMRRTELARQIGRAKGQGAVFMRPGREARVLRRLVARHTRPFPQPVVTRLWREITSVLPRPPRPFSAPASSPQRRPDRGSLPGHHLATLTLGRAQRVGQGGKSR